MASWVRASPMAPSSRVASSRGSSPSSPTGSQVRGSERIDGKRTGSPSWIDTGCLSRAPNGPTPTSVSKSSPRRLAAPAMLDSHPAGVSSNAFSAAPAGSGSSR
jgi:hypothetical protein